MVFLKGHPFYKGGEKGWFKKGFTPWSKLHKGIHLSPKSEWKKGHIPWIKGKEMPKGEVAYHWLGDKVGYGGVHQWLYKKYGKAKECEKCHSVGDIEWANISKKYKRDISDWMQLCISCHRKYDHVGTKAWITRRRKYQKGIL